MHVFVCSAQPAERAAATCSRYEPSYKIADPICTFIFSILVLLTTFNIMRQVCAWACVCVSLRARVCLPVQAPSSFAITCLLVAQALRIALNATPEHVDADAVLAALRAIPGVSNVHDLHIWTLSSSTVGRRVAARRAHRRAHGGRARAHFLWPAVAGGIGRAHHCG